MMVNNTEDKHIIEEPKSFFLIAGPCAIESQEICLEVAMECKAICQQLGIPYIFKSSFLKANRTRIDSFRTIGIRQALQILEYVKMDARVDLTTDIHESYQVKLVDGIVDMIQIPAFLCRQSELIESASRSGLAINIKKGQFIDSLGMRHAAHKAKSAGASSVFLTERGNSFGYNHLIVDMPNVNKMSSFCDGVIMDCTHATQEPNAATGITGGNPTNAELLARAALSVGAKGLFIETHPDPSTALSDGSNMIRLSDMKDLLTRLHSFSVAVNSVS